MTPREQLAALITQHGLTQPRTADLICQQADRSCSVRAVKAWLAEPDKPSSRSCPPWALIALRKALGLEDNQETEGQDA